MDCFFFVAKKKMGNYGGKNMATFKHMQNKYVNLEKRISLEKAHHSYLGTHCSLKNISDNMF